jgi:hypothetical protein
MGGELLLHLQWTQRLNVHMFCQAPELFLEDGVLSNFETDVYALGMVCGSQIRLLEI